jgi:hypothetical protein
MNYFIDDWIWRLFREDEDGKTYFYPWGPKKTGYILNNSAKTQKIRRFLKDYYVSMAFIMVGGAAFLSASRYTWTFATFVIWLIIWAVAWAVTYRIFMKRLTKDLHVTHEKQWYTKD